MQLLNDVLLGNTVGTDAIAPWNASLELTKGIIPQLEANRALTGVGSQEVNAQSLTPDNSDHIILPDTSLSQMTNATITDSNTSLTDSAVDVLTGQAMSEVHGDLSKFAAQADFVAKINLAFGENWDAASAKALAEGWFHQDFSDIPSVKVVSSAEIGGANGAFAEATDTIYLSRELVSGGNLGAIADVLLEEVGHSVDARLNVTDSPGDEGAIFAAVVQGKDLSEGELQGLRGESDTANVVLGGEDTTIELNQQQWVLSSWRNKDFEGEPEQAIYQNGNRSDGKDGIYINWGKNSPFSSNVEFVNPEADDNFATFGYATDSFEVGKDYNFRVSADDEIVILIQKVGTDLVDFITPPKWQTFPNGTFKNYSWTPTENGSYYVIFFHREYTGDAGVDISWEEDRISVETRSFDVNLSLYDKGAPNQRKTADSSNIDPNKDTVVVIHGRGSGGEDQNVFNLAEAAADSQYYPNSQVLYLDWRDAANDPGFPVTGIPYDAAKRISPVADWATKRLKELGIAPEKTILLGHSLGSYVASEIGRIGGRVKELVALDPAYPAGNYDINGNKLGDDRAIEFSKAATKSIALVASDADIDGGAAGDNDKASSANDSYIVYFIGYSGNNPIQKGTDYHNGVVNVFSDIIFRNFNFPSHQQDRFDDIGNWREQEFQGKEAFHEGKITANLTSGINGLYYVDSNGEFKRTWNS